MCYFLFSLEPNYRKDLLESLSIQDADSNLGDTLSKNPVPTEPA